MESSGLGVSEYFIVCFDVFGNSHSMSDEKVGLLMEANDLQISSDIFWIGFDKFT